MAKFKIGDVVHLKSGGPKIVKDWWRAKMKMAR